MANTYPGLYDNHDDANRAVADLRAAGVPESDISLVAHNSDGRYAPGTEETAPVATGATIGCVLGGGAGLLAGLGVMAIPGVGPVVAAGWLVSTLAGAVAGAAAGAATGGIVGSLTEAGVSEGHAHVYAEGVRRGGALVTARGDERLGSKIRPIYRSTGAIDPDIRGREYKSGGWKSFDAAASHYTAEEVERERARYRQQQAAE